MHYEAVIGMEVHAQIITESKMFCACSADYASAPPNTHVCPVCLAMPGVLPVVNQAAVEATLRTGLALHCEIPRFSKFDRKNYPYPDLPKGYQISQYDLPFCINGWLEIETDGQTKRIGIRRVHLEEDTAKLIHQSGSSLIDFNRAGVPLMEIVSEADIRSAEEAWRYLVKLRTILRYLGVNSGNMEEGALRCEANVSVRPVGSTEFGTKVEIKNLNSFRAVRQSIAYEIQRQSRLLEEGNRVQQVTMGWDEDCGCTVFQRSKEEAEDYRYFPEPDLPPMHLTPEWVQQLDERLPELPDAKQERFTADYGLRAEDAALLVEDQAIANYFEQAVRAADKSVSPRTIANWLTGEIFSLLREHGTDIGQIKIKPEQLAELLALVSGNTINATVAKDVLVEMFETGESAPSIVQRKGLTLISDEEQLRQIVREVLAANAKAVEDFQSGKEAALRFLIGQVMRATRGKANVAVAEDLLRQALGQR
ncbi:MAG: Asp-tRNA(Asn)/Glu-tRNA(Gln) amidotransferase subunit GatB [Chloroflexi bacterium]|jgi:aspartyl-tRNA(Asn)/glutamyl-tRNA(Gln) amidotransferase subunit B|nr:Asp-tRNA(Asn)/Glu-tRNA(Gln) amidotransferase subunit GatB [Chloroflexota bacterium]